MTNFNNTKRALISSAIALVMCMTMLLGTTFAWFTDSVTSTGNVIQTGNLDVQLFQHFEDGSVEITNDSDPIFGKGDSDNANANTADTLWEPGKTQTVYLSIKNNGSLDLKYTVAIEVTNVTKNLTDVMEYIITPDAQYGSVTKAGLDWTKGNAVQSGMNIAPNGDVALKSGEEHFFALSVHMDELAGNEYMNGNITFNIKVLAGQLASEYDSFDNQYDADATYPAGFAGATVVSGEDVSLVIFDDEDVKVATVFVPSEAIADNSSSVVASIVPSNYQPNITVDANSVVETLDISISSLKENNTHVIEVQYFIGEGFDPDTVMVYHYDEPLAAGDFAYNQTSGYVVIKATSFSPFTIVYDENSEYENGAQLPEGLPQAKVEYVAEYVGPEANIEWGNYGQWSPTEGLDAVLETAYRFSCIETPEQAADNPYAQWHCDFYVSLNRDLGENQIFLGGEYGSFGWIGFHNGDVTLNANEELPLLGSVTQNPWTYEMIADFVGEFICGVGHVGDGLDGATFTVVLRLTNPDDSSEFYNVAVINHTFN